MMSQATGQSLSRFPLRTTPGPMASMEKMMPAFEDITFWLVVNAVLFLFVGIFQLANGYGPGTSLSAGAIVLAVIYLLLWTYRKTNKKMADQWIMVLSGLAVLGDLIVIGWINRGAFTGSSAILDVAGLMLFRATYKDYRGP